MRTVKYSTYRAYRGVAIGWPDWGGHGVDTPLFPRVFPGLSEFESFWSVLISFRLSEVLCWACMSVCFSVSEWACQPAYPRKHTPKLQKKIFMLPMAVARSFSIWWLVVRYVLPVLWMTSRVSVVSPVAQATQVKCKLKVIYRQWTVWIWQRDVYSPTHMQGGTADREHSLVSTIALSVCGRWRRVWQKYDCEADEVRSFSIYY